MGFAGREMGFQNHNPTLRVTTIVQALFSQQTLFKEQKWLR